MSEPTVASLLARGIASPVGARMTFEQTVEAVRYAADELGGAAPKDEYLDEYDGSEFLAVPCFQSHDEHYLFGLIPSSAVTDPVIVATGPNTIRLRPTRKMIVTFIEMRPQQPVESFDPVSGDLAAWMRKNGLYYIAKEFERVGSPDAAAKARAEAERIRL